MNVSRTRGRLWRMAIYCGVYASENYTSSEYLDGGTRFYVCANPFHGDEFVTDETQDDELRRNSEDLDRFLAALSKGGHSLITPNRVLGPFSIPGYRDVPPMDSLFLAEATAFLRTI